MQPPLLKLRFVNSPPPTVFTASRITAEDGSPLAIELVDSATNTRVNTTDSIMLEILALDADISEENWTKEDFNRNILRSREGKVKRPLLVGDLTVNLKYGIGVIGGDVAFTDNSTWLKNGKFRLGAKAIEEGGIAEAITKAFVCNDYPGLGGESHEEQIPPCGNQSDQQKQEKRLHIPSSPKRKKSRVKQDVAPKATGLMGTGQLVTGLNNSVALYLNKDVVEAPSFTAENITASQKLSLTSLRNQQEDETFSDASYVFEPSKGYDVVVTCGRGAMRNNDFVAHLLAALSRRGISVHEDFGEGKEVPDCRLLIPFFTSTYVPPNLLSIVQQQPIDHRAICPLYYGISPSDLITNIKNYESFFLNDEPKEWHGALKKITKMLGYTLTNKSESELIDEIVRDAMELLSSYDNNHNIGIDMQIAEIVSLLCIESPDVHRVGIWGTVGIGKTTIAEQLLRKISAQYETCVFLKDLHNNVKLNGQDAVREEFLSKVLEVELHIIQFSDMKTSFLRSRLQRKKVLVILDDVNDFKDVEIFVGNLNYFGPGSRIIVTSRNRRVFVQCNINHVFEVKPLDISKCFLLLEHLTYRNLYVPKFIRKLPLELVKFSNGNPQVLRFLSGSYSERYLLLKKVKETSPIYIPSIFEKTCLGLDDNERSIFLDIACFFRKMDKDYIAMLLDGCGFSTHIGFRSLVDKSLLTISHNMVDMLSFIQATGREIVRQESEDMPGDRTRLWDSEDIENVFIDDTGTSAIEGIFMDMSNLKFDADPNVFEKMCNLRLLKFYFSEMVEKHGVSLPQGLEYLPSKLRLLHWEYYPLSSLPQSFDPKNLVELNLPWSSAEKLWKGKKSLEKLRKMRLSYSYKLTKISRLSSAVNLEHIDLAGCSSLVSVSKSISYLHKLVFLNLKDCSKLESVPSMFDLESLKVLNLSGCSKLENFPEISPNVKELYMGGTMIQAIPSSIKNLVLLEKLDLENSSRLKYLPQSIFKLKHLETLNLSGCTSLERFPDLSRRMKCLKSLDLSRTAIKELPSSISYLTALEELRFVDCKNLVRLPDNVWSLRFKVEFREIETEKFSKLWNRFGWLKKVQIS